MNEETSALLTGFMYGCLLNALLNALMYWLLNKHFYAKQRKLRDEVRNTMRSTIYPSSAGWWELHKKLEAVGAKPRKHGMSPVLAYPYGQEQQHANENPRGTAQRSDTDAST